MKKAKFNLILNSAQLVDVMFLADATGSMGPCLANVKTNMITAWQNFQASTNWNVQVGVSFYRDSMDPQPFQVLQAITNNKNLIQTAVNNLSSIGGGDTPEGQFGALTLLAPRNSAGWRPGATRIIAWFGDQPAHDPYILNGITYTLANTINALLDWNINICAFSMNTGSTGNQLDATGQATAITKACDFDNQAHVQLGVSITNVAQTIFNYIQAEKI